MPLAEHAPCRWVYARTLMQRMRKRVARLGRKNEGDIRHGWKLGAWLVQHLACIAHALERCGYSERDQRLKHPHKEARLWLRRVHRTYDEMVHGLALHLLDKVVAQHKAQKTRLSRYAGRHHTALQPLNRSIALSMPISRTKNGHALGALNGKRMCLICVSVSVPPHVTVIQLAMPVLSERRMHVGPLYPSECMHCSAVPS